MGILEKIK